MVNLSKLRPLLLARGIGVISLDDVVITNMIAGPGQETLPIYMLAQLRRTTTPEINAVSTALLAISVLLVSLSFLLGREKE